MVEKTYATSQGVIHYWMSEKIDVKRHTLIFLPGLTSSILRVEKMYLCGMLRGMLLHGRLP